MRDKRSTVSVHAVQRFVERAMGMVAPDIIPNTMKEQITEKIMTLLDEHYPLHLQLSSGNFKIADLGVIIIKGDHRIVTVKEINNSNALAYSGGIMRSGSKKKKSLDRKAWKDQ